MGMKTNAELTHYAIRTSWWSEGCFAGLQCPLRINIRDSKGNSKLDESGHLKSGVQDLKLDVLILWFAVNLRFPSTFLDFALESKECAPLLDPVYGSGPWPNTRQCAQVTIETGNFVEGFIQQQVCV
jgi:hypothetical protein